MNRLIALLVCTASVVGCASQASLEFRPATYEASDASSVAQVPPGADQPVYLSAEPVLTGRDVVSASATMDEAGRPAIDVVFSSQAGDRLYDYTRNHVGQPLAIVFEGDLISAPVIVSPMRARAVITGQFTEDDVQRILSSLSGE